VAIVELRAVRNANEVGELDRTIALHLIETACIGERVRKDDHALHRRHRGELRHFRADERGQDLRVVADLVRRRGALILIAPVPEPSAIFGAATEMFEIDQDQSVRRHDDQVDLSVLTPLVGLPHHEIGKALPLVRKSKANVRETSFFGGLRAFGPENLMSMVACARWRPGWISSRPGGAFRP
jgi:hypothetical protein